MGHNGSPSYDDVIHVALIARDRASLITSFQPPLTMAHEVILPLPALDSDVIDNYH